MKRKPCQKYLLNILQKAQQALRNAGRVRDGENHDLSKYPE